MVSQQEGINRKRGRPTSLNSQEIVEADIYKFDQCYKPYLNLQSLKNHQRIHAGEKPHQCTYPSCNKAFRQIWKLEIHQKRHTKETAEGKKPHKCTHPRCNKTFRQISQLKIHQKRHTSEKSLACSVEGEKPHQCTYPSCAQAFRKIGLLKTHHKCHTGEKSFVCSAEGCLQRFTRVKRSCPIHPWKKLRKDGKGTIQYSDHLTEEKLWIKEYEKNKNNRLKKRKILQNRKHSSEPKHYKVQNELITETSADHGFYLKRDLLYSFDGIQISRVSDTSITEKPLPSSNPVKDVGDVISMETVLHAAENKTEEKRLPDLPIPVISLDDSLDETAVNLPPNVSATELLPTLNAVNDVRRSIITKTGLAVAREETPENMLLRLPIKKRLLRTFNSVYGVRRKAEIEAAVGLLCLNMLTR